MCWWGADPHPERLITANATNQLEHVLEIWRRGVRRPSALQVGFFDPANDHRATHQLGFPCLHQLAVIDEKNDKISLNAFYGSQLIAEKALGNYLGILRLGEFLASEMECRLRRVTCVSSVAIPKAATGLSKVALMKLLDDAETTF